MIEMEASLNWGLTAVLTLSLVLTSAPDLINSSATSELVFWAALCNGDCPNYNPRVRFIPHDYTYISPRLHISRPPVSDRRKTIPRAVLGPQQPCCLYSHKGQLAFFPVPRYPWLRSGVTAEVVLLCCCCAQLGKWAEQKMSRTDSCFPFQVPNLDSFPLPSTAAVLVTVEWEKASNKCRKFSFLA